MFTCIKGLLCNMQHSLNFKVNCLSVHRKNARSEGRVKSKVFAKKRRGMSRKQENWCLYLTTLHSGGF